jgi:hypothetical protein
MPPALPLSRCPHSPLTTRLVPAAESATDPTVVLIAALVTTALGLYELAVFFSSLFLCVELRVLAVTGESRRPLEHKIPLHNAASEVRYIWLDTA